MIAKSVFVARIVRFKLLRESVDKNSNQRWISIVDDKVARNFCDSHHLVEPIEKYKHRGLVYDVQEPLYQLDFVLHKVRVFC